MRLTITRTFAVAELGTVAFLAEESVEVGASIVVLGGVSDA